MPNPNELNSVSNSPEENAWASLAETPFSDNAETPPTPENPVTPQPEAEPVPEKEPIPEPNPAVEIVADSESDLAVQKEADRTEIKEPISNEETEQYVNAIERESKMISDWRAERTSNPDGELSNPNRFIFEAAPIKTELTAEEKERFGIRDEQDMREYLEREEAHAFERKCKAEAGACHIDFNLKYYDLLTFVDKGIAKGVDPMTGYEFEWADSFDDHNEDERKSREVYKEIALNQVGDFAYSLTRDYADLIIDYLTGTDEGADTTGTRLWLETARKDEAMQKELEASPIFRSYDRVIKTREADRRGEYKPRQGVFDDIRQTYLYEEVDNILTLREERKNK